MINRAEILAIGDELCYGRVYDTNSFWLADQVTKLGIIVQRIICVRDDSEEICKVLREMISRTPRFILISGGLGPTEDDKTIEALSKLTGRNVIVDQSILKIMAEKRKFSHSQLLPRHFKMSSTIEGAECLPNPVGWAPLTIIKIDETTIFTLPGPPKEMQNCFTTYLLKDLENATHYHSFAKRVTVTMFESEVAPLISEIHKSIPGIYMKPLVGESSPNLGLPVEIIAFDYDKEKCHEKYSKALARLTELVKQNGKDVKEF